MDLSSSAYLQSPILRVLPSSLTVSIVTYRSDAVLLERCLVRLADAIRAAREQRVVTQVAVALIDNSEDAALAAEGVRLANRAFVGSGVQLHFLNGHANVGYGVAHNLMLNGTGGDYQLVLNPDVELALDALANAIRWLDANASVVAAAPAVSRPDGTPDFLCKRYPAVLDLLLRGFAPAFVRRLFAERLARYDLRDVIDPTSPDPVRTITVMSGCCMLVRRKAIDATGGFDPNFFLYFEDYDWSVRLRKIGETAYVPSFRVVHHGGGAAHKGWKHIGWFVQSGMRFYRKHGWRFV
jgi:GT2 family glycosyltransferase